MLPFDIDTKFVKERQADLARTAYAFFDQLQRDSEANNRIKVTSLTVFNERLVAPAGPTGFRVATKIHPFWNTYLNGLGVAIADALEPERDASARSYRFLPAGGHELFNRECLLKAIYRSLVGYTLCMSGDFPQNPAPFFSERTRIAEVIYRAPQSTGARTLT